MRMLLVFIGLILGMLFVTSTSLAQPITYKEGTPEWIISHFILKGSVPNAREYLGGEMAVYIDTPLTVAPEDAKNVVLKFRRLQDSGPTVYTSYMHSEYAEVDIYWFFDRDRDKHRLVAMRTLAQTWLYDYLIKYADTVLASDTVSKETRQELTRQVANARLVIGTDSVLKEYFFAHRASFERLRELNSKSPASIASSEETQKLIDSLHLSNVYPKSEESDYIQIVIGGILDNTVGFLYLSDPSDSPPRMTGSEWIYVEEIAPRWYIFKTT